MKCNIVHAMRQRHQFIVNKIKRSKLERGGHACRKRNSMRHRVLQENARSERPLGRPRLRWVDSIEKDFPRLRRENYGGQDWKEIAENKEEWKRICSITRWS